MQSTVYISIRRGRDETVGANHKQQTKNVETGLTPISGPATAFDILSPLNVTRRT